MKNEHASKITSFSQIQTLRLHCDQVDLFALRELSVLISIGKKPHESCHCEKDYNNQDVCDTLSVRKKILQCIINTFHSSLPLNLSNRSQDDSLNHHSTISIFHQSIDGLVYR